MSQRPPPVRKAVIPAAGFGTRFLPATKSQPKEMLPIVDTPTIHYVVEEAVSSGITDILMIIGRGKRAIEEYFDRNPMLEAELAEQGKQAELAAIRRISSMANVHFVWQKELRGLGDAISYAADHVGDEPFAVLLGDTVVQARPPLTEQLVRVFQRYRKPVIALEEAGPEKISRYGVIRGNRIADNVYLVEDLIEKPAPAEAPSNLVVAGRYVLTPEIFEFIAGVEPGRNGEIQLTDAMRAMLATGAMYGLRFAGRRYDIGNKLDFLKTNLTFALRDESLKDELSAFIKDTAARL